MDNPEPLSTGERLFAGLQAMLPTRLLSWLMHKLAAIRLPWFKNSLIYAFIRLYRVDLESAAITDPKQFESFNAFFTRALHANARPLPQARDALVSPVDGIAGRLGAIRSGRLLQAKGTAYAVADLLAGDAADAAPFLGGDYATLYLAPNNYHRVHMPVEATLRETRYVPGRLFGVNPASARAIPRLFTRNERLVCHFDTAAGPMAMVLVGALCVGGIETVWSGQITPPHRRHGDYQTVYPAAGNDRIKLARGAEMGRFNLGSTVILLFGAGAVQWNLSPGDAVRMGSAIGRLRMGV